MGDDPSQPSVSNTNHRKELNRSRLDRFVKKVGQKLLPKPCDTIFVPSSIASGPSCISYSYSTDGEQSSTHDDFYHSRKTSAPASGTALPELSINTFGGEAAGSGYGWINTPGVGEPYHGVESVIKAQQLGLQMVNERIEWTKEQIDLCCSDEKMIAEFVAEAFVEEMNAIRNRSNYLALRDSVKRLENEIDELRQLSPKSVPPPRPARPHEHLTWSCVRCLEDNSIAVYRCRCSFPRPAIDPREASRCNCIHCCQLTADRMFVSPTPGDGDWLLVNKLSPNNGPATPQWLPKASYHGRIKFSHVCLF